MTTLIFSIVFLFLGFGLMVWARIEFGWCTRMLEDCKGIMEMAKGTLDARKRFTEDMVQRLMSVDRQIDAVLEEYSVLCAAVGRTGNVEYHIISEPNCHIVCKRVPMVSKGKERFPRCLHQAVPFQSEGFRRERLRTLRGRGTT